MLESGLFSSQKGWKPEFSDGFLERDTDESPEAIDSLPGYLQESGRLDEVISFLSPDYFSSMLNRSESLIPLRRQLQIGIDVAAELRQDGELVRFGLESSAIREIETAQVSRFEIEALVTTDQVSEALSFAANCSLREDRLHLLGVIARCQKERGTPPSEEILDQIRQLHGQIDAKSLGDKAIDIATDLFPCCPDLAVSLIEQSSWADGDENELDIAYVRLSIATAVHGTVPRSDQDDLETIRKRIRNPRLRGFTSALSGKVQSAAEVIAEAEKLGTASDKLYILRAWAIEHSARENALDVAEHGLRTVVEATRYAPNVRVLRELSTPLLHAKDLARTQSLVRTFDGQRTTVEDQGPTEEVVRLQLNLAVAESLFDEEACVNRLVEVFLSVHELADLSTKSSCLARLLSALRIIDSSGRIEDKEHLTSLSTEELDTAISDLLAHTAEQVDVTRRIIDALASLDVGRSITLAENLNTAVRREEALLLAVDSILESDSDRIDLKRLREACKNLLKRESRDHVATAVAEYLARRGSSGQEAIVESGFQLFQDIFFSVSDPMERCRVLCLLYVLAEKGLYTASEAVRLDLSKRIEEALADIEPGWGRIDAGFRVARSFADRRPTQAKGYLGDAEAERRRTALSSFSSEWTYQACLRLSIRAFAGQLGHGYDPEDDMARLGRLIDRLQSASLRVQLWGELAMHLFLQQHSDDGNRVVSEHVVPLLDSMPEGPVKASTIIAVSPALYRNHKTTALRLFDTIEGYQRDRALMTCAEFILEQHIPSDPYEAHEKGYKITYQDAIDVAELASKISRDNFVYVLIVALAETLLPSSRFSRRFSQQQRAELIRWIENLVDGKFPDQDNIRHDGYAIASKAQLLRIERGSSQSWRDLIEHARSIPNRSDRAYVLAIIGQVLPAREANRQEAVFKEAMDVTETIPCTYDRLARLNDLAGMMAQKCPHLARKCLSDTIAGFQVAEDGADARVSRDMIDTAFKIDADFAASLVSLADDDPARTMARHEMKRRSGNAVRKKSYNRRTGVMGRVRSQKTQTLPRSTWLALGSLNAGRVHTASIDQIRLALRAAGQFALHDGFPILAWVIENAVRRFSGTSQSRSMIRVIFEGAMRATEFVEIAGTSASVTVRRGTLAESTPPSEESMVVKVGERDRAVEFLRRVVAANGVGTPLYL